MSVTAFLADLEALIPEPARPVVLAGCAAPVDRPETMPVVWAHFFDVADEVVTAFVVLTACVVRVQVTRQGSYQRGIIPLRCLQRVDEVFDAGRLTVILEIDADAQTLSLVGATIDNRYEVQGTLLRNGYVLGAEGSSLSRLAAFAAGLRARMLDQPSGD